MSLATTREDLFCEVWWSNSSARLQKYPRCLKDFWFEASYKDAFFCNRFPHSPFKSPTPTCGYQSSLKLSGDARVKPQRGNFEIFRYSGMRRIQQVC